MADVQTPSRSTADRTIPDLHQAHFTVYDLTDLTPVGNTLLVRIDHHQGTAEFGILIGERRGQGLGTEATRLTLDWGFTVLGLHNILLTTFSLNTAALRAYEKAGFREIGRRRGAVVTLGHRFDHILMDAVADSSPAQSSAARLPPKTRASSRS